MHSKTLSLRTAAICLILCLYNLCSTYPVFAQQASRTVTGKVLDENKQPMPGVAILIVGTTSGGTTDFDGNFTLSVPAGNNELQFSFIGYETVKMPIPANNNIRLQMKPQTMTLDDVVVIGYGTSRKGDLTGAVANVSSKDFNEGMISSPEQLINGKIAGVQIMSNSGSPTAGSTIRIRGGASLNASNDPLIVLDGVPLEIGGISGNNSNFLSLINPNDIESMTVLKDASSTAIYGSRASNGVIIITTKKGADSKLKISFNTTNSLQVRTQTADMLSRGEFINIVNSNGTDAQKALLGTANTDWNDEIYNVAFGTDNNLSFSGKLKNIPYRVSLGYYNQDGILRTDNAERITGNISVSPGFFNNYLKFNVNIKGSLNKNRFANGGAIWAASTYNPTLPVHSGNDAFGGYTEAIDNTGTPVTRGVRNPLGLLRQYKSTSDIKRVIGNADVDYKLHFLPELKFHATVGYDYAEGKGKIYVPEEAAEYATTGGRDFTYGPQINTNRLLTTYLNYNKTFGEFTVDATAGYDYQAWKSSSEKYSELNVAGIEQKSIAASDQRHVLLSYYGRLNLTYDTRYMLTATIRRDGTSRFNKDNRWGTFPSLALAWRISEESFLENWETLSNLKLRGSYGVTGQQDIIGNDYPYLANYTISNDKAQYQFGNDFIYTLRPNGYDANIKWEETTTWNVALDYGFFNNRINGSIDYYYRKTKDLLNEIPIAAGSNLTNKIVTNVGDLSNQGFEFVLNTVPVDNDKWHWEFNVNLSYNKNKIIKLIRNKDPNYMGVLTGGISGGTGSTIQIHSEGHESNAFYVYRQVYDKAGKPIEGVYADLNKDGIINQSDLYRYKGPAPKWLAGFSSYLTYKNWDLNIAGRFSFGNYVYNNIQSNGAIYSRMYDNTGFYSNIPSDVSKTNFRNPQYFSDYYVQNASFMKLDNITLGYNFKKLWHNRIDLRLYAIVQNVFTITKYKGLDPEIFNGIDNNFYPRPRNFVFGVNLGF